MVNREKGKKQRKSSNGELKEKLAVIGNKLERVLIPQRLGAESDRRKKDVGQTSWNCH